MNRNQKKNDGVDIIAALCDLCVILIEKAIQGIVWLIGWLLARYVFGDGRGPVKKIEGRHLAGKKVTANPDSIGHSLSRRKDLLASELSRGTHTLICGPAASASRS